MNRKEINQKIRNISRNYSTCKCELCKSKKNVQTHHIIKVDTLTNIAYLNRYNTSELVNTLYIPTIKVCEKCHIMLHALMMDNYAEPDITYDDFIKVYDVLASIDSRLAPEELQDDYYNAIRELDNKVLFNLMEFGTFTEEELAEIEYLLYGDDEEQLE